MTFQCLLITDGQSTFTVFNYIDVDLNPIKNKKIAIGYQYGTNFERNSLSNKDMAFRMSDIPGNRGMKTIFYNCFLKDLICRLLNEQMN